MRILGWGGSALLVVSTVFLSCINAPPFVCTKNEQCNSKPPGICVQFEGRQGYCAVPVGDCPSGYRYHNSAAPELINTCALIPKFEVQSPVTTIEEHQQFTVHVIVRDNNNQKYTSYAGKPTVTSNWGDVRVLSGGDFTGGETDITVWLNRETNLTDGPAAIILQDGSATGRSGGIVVTVPAWMPSTTGTPAPSDTDVKLTGSYALVRRPGQTDYDFFYALYKSGTVNVPEEIYHATTPNFNNWQTKMTPALQRNQVPFQNNASNIQPQAALFGGGLYRLLFLINQGVGIAESVDGDSWKFRRSASLLVDATAVPETCRRVAGINGLVDEGQGVYRIFYESRNAAEATIACTAVTMDGGLSFYDGTALDTGANNFAFVNTVVKDGSVYHAWGGNAYATSSDAVRWIRSPVTTSFDVRAVVWNEDPPGYVGLHRVDLRQVQRLNRR